MSSAKGVEKRAEIVRSVISGEAKPVREALRAHIQANHPDVHEYFEGRKKVSRPSSGEMTPAMKEMAGGSSAKGAGLKADESPPLTKPKTAPTDEGMVESRMMSAAEAVALLAELAAELVGTPSLDELLARALDLATDIVPGCEQSASEPWSPEPVMTPGTESRSRQRNRATRRTRFMPPTASLFLVPRSPPHCAPLPVPRHACLVTRASFTRASLLVPRYSCLVPRAS